VINRPARVSLPIIVCWFSTIPARVTKNKSSSVRGDETFRDEANETTRCVQNRKRRNSVTRTKKFTLTNYKWQLISEQWAIGGNRTRTKLWGSDNWQARMTRGKKVIPDIPGYQEYANHYQAQLEYRKSIGCPLFSPLIFTFHRNAKLHCRTEISDRTQLFVQYTCSKRDTAWRSTP